MSIQDTVSSPLPRVDGSDALSLSHFYGREEELAQLSEWIVKEHARIISVLGMGGIGKSALSTSLISQISVGTAVGQGSPLTGPCPFEVIIFRSLRDAPALEILLDSCLEVFAEKSLRLVPSTLEQRLDLLLSHLGTTRTLIVLENLECLLLAGDPRGHFQQDFLGYGQLLHRVANTTHQSCLLITSREQPANLRLLAGRYPPSGHTLHLAGLPPSACKQILVEQDMVGTEAEQEQLIELCGGNPLALKIVTATLLDLFSGEIGLSTETVLVGGIRELLDEHFARLSPLEQSVLFWLAIVREPITLRELQTLLVIPRPLLEAVESLRRRSLLVRGKRVGSFTLRSVVLEYVTTVLITEAVNEIEHSRFGRLIEHSLCLSSAREYVCQSQERLLLCPVLANLQNIYRGEQALEKQLLGLLEGLREQADTTAGYGPANLIALLRLLRGNLHGLNLSRLSVRGAYLQDVQMQETSLSG